MNIYAAYISKSKLIHENQIIILMIRNKEG